MDIGQGSANQVVLVRAYKGFQQTTFFSGTRRIKRVALKFFCQLFKCDSGLGLTLTLTLMLTLTLTLTLTGQYTSPCPL
jgi:hypothetical protein